MGFQAGTSKSTRSSTAVATEDWLVGGGEMGKLIRSMDWSESPLGPIESWPQSLRTTVSLCLASNFPISIAWGPKYIQIYNDGYWPICGGNHPRSMGQDFSECWAAPWPVIGESFERALAGQTSYLENQRMFLDRNGYLEETCFTFSFSPIRDESGGVGGLFHPVTETTSRMLSERRVRALRDLAARAGKAQTEDDAFTEAAQTLAEYELDVPFGLFYSFAAAHTEARLTASVGLERGAAASPEVVNRESRRGWPLMEMTDKGDTRYIDDLESRFGIISVGPYFEPLRQAVAIRITPPGCEQPIGVFIAGVSSRLPLNETYRGFFDLLGASVTTAVANARAYQQERRRAEALAEIDRAKTAFFSNVSHEFRTPLTLMLGPLEDELAEQVDPLPTARRERLETAHRNSLRLLKLVNSLLDFSRIEAGRVQATYEPTELAAYTVELASVFRSAIEKAGLTLTIDCQNLPEAIYVDREMWEKIVLNLVSNAFKHTFTGGIDVTLLWREDCVELAVTDTGVGIPAEALPRIFDRFHRIKDAKSRTHEGTGIGLALVRELVALHGGKAWVESQEGKGSTFRATVRAGTNHLPVERASAMSGAVVSATRAAAFVDETRQWLSSETSPSNSSFAKADAIQVSSPTQLLPVAGAKRSRILWADDNADMRDYVRRLLADRYEVLCVCDGLEALAAAEGDPPDLILTDVMMPGLDGFGLLRELRKGARTKTVPVILLSARAGEESALEGLDAGADDYLAKPFTARELLARVRTHLELAQVRLQWVKELEFSNRKLEASNKELEAFSYSVSHDLRNPLMSLQGFSELLLDMYASNPEEKGQKYLRRIKDAAARMSCLIEDLLKLSKMNKQALRICDVNLELLVEDVVSELECQCVDRKIEWRIGSLPAIRCDHGLIRQVFTNLIANAIKYTRTRDLAIIEIGESDTDEQQIFMVRDNGVGFDMQTAGRLFTAFQRFHRAEDFEGTGIGLATVQRIVSRHGGRIWADAEVGRGATFQFTLGMADELG